MFCRIHLQLILAFLIFSRIVSSQNLVPNYSFETYTACPTASGQIGYAPPWYGYSVDYMNACAPSTGLSVPYIGGIFQQYARTGNAFAAFWAGDPTSGTYREYVQMQLSDTLISGKCYYIEFYLSFLNGGRFAVNNIGAHFSSSTFTTNGSLLSIPAHILKFGNPVIKDTLSWVQVAGLFSSTGIESYLTIGNFFDDANTVYQTDTNGYISSPYYYIDDVSVVPTDSLNMPAYAGPDTTIAQGDSVFIGQEISNLNCNWYVLGGSQIATNISGIFVTPTVTTTYVVEQNLCGAITYDSVKVTVDPIGVHEHAKNGKLRVYPNPTSGELFIRYPGARSLSIEIYDLSGRLLKNEVLPAEKGAVKLELNLKNGTYLLQVLDPETAEQVFKRIIINK